MDETISDPLALQRGELRHLDELLARLQNGSAELNALLRSGGATNLTNIVVLARRLDEQLRVAQRHSTAAGAGADQIERAAEARRQEAHHLRTLYGVGQAINSTLELRDVLNLLMDKVVEVTRAERGYIVLRDELSGKLTVAVARGIEQSAIEDEAFSISRGLVREVATSGKPIVTTNAQADPRFAAMESVRNYSLRSIMCAPLIVRGQVGGVVYVDHRMRESAFGPRDLNLLVSIAHQAGIAIDNARVFGYLTNVLASIANGVVTVDPRGAISTFNRAAATIFGLPAEQAIGRPYAEVFGLLANSPLPGLVAEVRNRGETVLRHEVRAMLPGRGEVALLINAGRVMAETGELLGIVMVVEDITHTRRMEHYIAPNVVEYLRVAAGGPRLGGQLREITVLFGDVRGYTALSEVLPPEELLNLLNAHLSLAAGAIMDERFGGTLDKYIGDAVMGLFNTPDEQPDHAWRAVCAAWEMQTRLRTFQESLAPEHHLRFRVGVNTGQAVVGHIGTESLMNFTAIGDAVNVAKRLQESARPGQVVISEATYTSIAPDQRSRLHVRPLGFISLKGRTAEVPAYEVLVVEV